MKPQTMKATPCDQHAAHDRLVARRVERVGAVEHRHDSNRHVSFVFGAGNARRFIMMISADSEMM